MSTVEFLKLWAISDGLDMKNRLGRCRVFLKKIRPSVDDIGFRLFSKHGSLSLPMVGTCTGAARKTAWSVVCTV